MILPGTGCGGGGASLQRLGWPMVLEVAQPGATRSMLRFHCGCDEPARQQATVWLACLLAASAGTELPSCPLPAYNWPEPNGVEKLDWRGALASASFCDWIVIQSEV